MQESSPPPAPHWPQAQDFLTAAAALAARTTTAAASVAAAATTTTTRTTTTTTTTANPLTASTATTTTILLIVGTFAYLYFKHKFAYWARHGLKTPTPIPWFGTGLWPLFTPKPVLELAHHRALGKLYGLYDGLLGTNPTLVCGHPEVLKQVTIKHFDSFTNRRRPATWKAIRYRALTYMRDDEWKQMRKILAPTFTSNKLKKMFELMKRCTRNLEGSVDYQGAREIDLKKLFSVFTVDVISTCCFSMDLKDYRHPDSEILISARKFFNVSRLKMAFAMAVPKQILALCGFDINDTTSIDFFARFAQEIINKRRKLSAQQQMHYKKQDDFLQTLIDAAAEFNDRNEPATTTTTTTKPNEANERTRPQPPQQDVAHGSNSAPLDARRLAGKEDEAACEQEQQVQQRQQQQRTLVADGKPEREQEPQSQVCFTEQQLGDLEILAQSMLFFAVGHETTATLLSSCGLFLALHPHLQERLYQEVHAAFEEGKGDISYDTLLELQYLDAFISEALRFYTPTLTFDREASEDVEIELEGFKFTIPKGMGVVIPFHAIHHDPDNYEEPERFDPERFMPENRHKIKPCTFIPFGSGPRFCLASRFALVEAKLALANLVNKYKFVESEGTIWPPRFRHHYMLLQMEWPKVKFVKRLDEAAAAAAVGTAASAISATTGRPQVAAA